MPKHPLAEVFGFPTDNLSDEAMRFKLNRLCPFNNSVPSCTKVSVRDPLGVCSVFGASGITITCPIRFRQDWLIATDAAEFFFATGSRWTSITEVRLADELGGRAGNIDLVLVAYDDAGRVTDFGAVEVQAVYISGNVCEPFERYMVDPEGNRDMDWRGQPNYPRPDYLSSTRKRLAPQLVYKGGILNGWGKKLVVAVHSALYDTLPTLPEVALHEADIAWLVYDLVRDRARNRYQMALSRKIYTQFQPALDRITMAQAGSMERFVDALQSKLDIQLGGVAPPDDTPPSTPIDA